MSSHEKLKQPNKYMHELLQRQNDVLQEGIQEPKESDKSERKQVKTKKIKKQRQSKLPDRKVIKKKFQPSALRLKAINQTFHKIENYSEDKIAQFNFDQEIFNNLLAYNQKCKCKCDRNIKYFCLRCLTWNEQLKLPKINLPCNVTIIHHTSEKINKSSIIPMIFLTDQVNIIKFDGQQIKKQKKEQSNNENQNTVINPLQLPFEINQQTLKQTYILFPHKQSQKVTKQVAENIKNLMILDCTWFQTDIIINELDKKGFTQYIRLDNYQSLFWRYNHHNDKALSSAESLAYFMRQYQTVLERDKQQFDNLMLLYCLNLKIVKDSYANSLDKQVQMEQK